MANYALTLVHGPGWDPDRPIREQRGWAEHAAFMDGLVADGTIILGADRCGGVSSLDVAEGAGGAADERAVRARGAADPWGAAGLLRVGSHAPWAFWLDSRDDVETGRPH